MTTQQAILEVMGVSLDELRSKSRESKVYLARLVYADLRFKQGAKPGVISRELSKSKRIVYYYLSKVYDERRYSRQFDSVYCSVAHRVMGCIGMW